MHAQSPSNGGKSQEKTMYRESAGNDSGSDLAGKSVNRLAGWLHLSALDAEIVFIGLLAVLVAVLFVVSCLFGPAGGGAGGAVSTAGAAVAFMSGHKRPRGAKKLSYTSREDFDDDLAARRWVAMPCGVLHVLATTGEVYRLDQEVGGLSLYSTGAVI